MFLGLRLIQDQEKTIPPRTNTTGRDERGSGQTEEGARAVSSHTGTMAGADRGYDAVFRRAGAFRVDSFEEMFDLAKAFEFCPLPARDRIGVVSITGVGCVLASDQAGRYGLRLPDFSAPALATILGGAPEVVQKFNSTLEANRVPVYSSVDRMLAAARALAARAAFLRDRKRNPAR